MKKKILYLTMISLFFCIKGSAQGHSTDTTNYLASNNWDNNSLWSLSANAGVSAAKSNFSGLNNNGMAVTYTFPVQGDWFNMDITLPDTFNDKNSIALFVKSSTASNSLELKFMDKNGTVFRRVIPLEYYSNEWKHIVIFLSDMTYAWGGNGKFDKFSLFSIAANGLGSGTIWFDEIGIGKAGLQSTLNPLFDPDSTLAGTGFAQRRNSMMTQEDTLVLKYLEVMQDTSSTDKRLIPSMEDDQAQTFNNSLATIAFTIKGERDRAERILDFYANATDKNNKILGLQNFYYNGEARGFYQYASITTKYGWGDRWIGDMAWLLIACKNFELKYNSNRYDNLINIIKDLFISLYRDYPSEGYVETGWRNGDASFDTTGHQEGNIDCYVLFKLLGDNYRAQKIKKWEEKQLQGLANLPLDLYSWRVLAFGKDYASLLNTPEYSYSYRKVIKVRGSETMGFYSGADIGTNNFWNDGTGQMSCAYQAFGDTERGYFYANQMDPLIINRTIGKNLTHAIPYTLNKTGGYSWVDTTKGFSSACSWYIIVKNKYNPFKSANFKDTTFNDTVRYPAKYNPLIINNKVIPPSVQLYPNPFSSSTIINYYVPSGTYVNISIYDIRGEEVRTLVNKGNLEGNYSITWNGQNNYGCNVSNGIYFINITFWGDTNSHSVYKLIKAAIF